MRNVKDLLLPALGVFEQKHLCAAYGKDAETDMQIKEDGNLHVGFWVSHRPLVGGWRILFTPEEIAEGAWKSTYKDKFLSLCNEVLEEFGKQPIVIKPLGEKKDD